MSRNYVSITVPSRIAIGLIGLSERGYRINGGAGWALLGPSIEVRASRTSSYTVCDTRLVGMAKSELMKLEEVLHAFCQINDLSPVGIEIAGDVATHAGLGSGTAIRLAALESTALLNNKLVPREALVLASGRGGTSGIGVRTYFEGGFILDVGQRSGDSPRPSHAWEKPQQALQLTRLDMPSWPIGLYQPQGFSLLSHEEEREFFERVLPISFENVAEVLYHMTYGVAGAIAEADHTTFCRAVDAIQSTTWKAAEWSRYGERLRSEADILRLAGAEGLGMSSLGPLLYFSAASFDMSKLPANIASRILITRAANCGRKVELQ